MLLDVLTKVKVSPQAIPFGC